MSVVIPSLRGAIAVPGWAKNELWRRARAVPSLDLRFADNKSLVDATTGQNLVTFTRASSGTFVGSDGLLQSAANDVPRFDHNPTTGESLGLLVEEQRTNSLANNTMVGAVDGTPGTLPTGWAGSSTANGITREIVGTGTEDGIAYIDLRFSGTNTLGSNFFQTIVLSNSVVAATGQTWTGSAYVRLLAGAITGASFTGTGGSLILFGSPSFADNTTVSIDSVSSARLATQRYSATRTFTNVTTTGADWRVAWTSVTGATIDFTLRIGLPQLELGAFATSAILTSTAAATRSADVASITGSAFSGFYRQDEGTVFAEYNRPVAVTGLRSMAATSNSDFANRTTFRSDSATALAIFAFDGSVIQASFNLTSISGINNKAAVAYQVNNYNAALNGILGINDTAATVHAANQLSIGSVLNAERSCSYIRRICYWPQRLGNQVLQSIT